MGRNRGHIPIRTCVSCGAKGEKPRFFRIVLDEENRAVIDDRCRKKGRGVYVCKKQACRESLIRGRRLQKAFNVAGDIRIEDVFGKDVGPD
jgi:predicted RNA-binding protein YlxR (DUF448 family)